MTEKAGVLVHGATGFTGGLVCELLSKRGIRYAISGRSRERLEPLQRRLGSNGGAPPVEVCVVDLERADSIVSAIDGRTIVLACAGPFALVGEPILAACARLGVHYVDTTGEQRFVADAAKNHQSTCEASRACIVPAMAYEIAPADWACHLAAARVGGSPDTIEVFYSSRNADGANGSATTRGTKKSILGVLAERAPLQWIDGSLVVEASAEKTTSFALPNGRRLAAASFPSPEAIVVPQHTGARTVRTYMAMGESTARNLHRFRKLAPAFVRATRSLADRWLDRGPAGPEGDDRGGTFTIIAEATKGSERARIALSGSDPYGLTAELQVYAAERALAGAITAKGIVGPSVAFPARDALIALAHTGLSLVEPA
ncbi:MAG: hypothetical protein QOI41_651 [Myxococcales bacterium]|jgi:short subunit dehydrogenase-like uncharacterized protein|nr:hypothetical protein [Myxococcales bacterium]